MRRWALVIVVIAGVFVAVGFTCQQSAVRVVMRARLDVSAGAVGGLMTTLFGGGGVGTVVAVTLRGARLATEYRVPGSGSQSGTWIVDFNEETTYHLLPATREYTSQTFRGVRGKIADQHSVGESAVPGMDRFLPTTGVSLPAQSRRRANRFEYEVEREETGRRRQIGDYDVREVVVTVIAHERGKTLENDGGWFVTNTVWLAPPIPAVDALVAAQRRYTKMVTSGIYTTAFTDVEFPANYSYDPFYPEQAIVGARVIAETEKLEGTVLSSVAVYDMERTAGEFKSALNQYAAQQRRLAASGARVLGGPPPKRTRLVTMALDYLSIDWNVADDDLSIPAGFTRRKN